MSEETGKSPNKPSAAEKEQRLKDALRANLRRRKSAARKAKSEPDTPSDPK